MGRSPHPSRGKPRAPVKTDLSAETVRALFSYEPDTGLLRWKVSSRLGIRPGDVAGTIGRTGYVMVSIKKRLYSAHRLIWLIVHGRWPRQMIDHINGKRADNRLVNLREATPSLNGMNRPRMRNNTSGYPGVGRCGARWGAFLWRHGKQYHLGTHETPQRAYAVYLAVTKLLMDDESRRINSAERQLSA